MTEYSGGTKGQMPAEKAVADIVYAMEEHVQDIENWASVVTDLGMCGNDVRAAGLYNVGVQLEESVKFLRNQWKTIFALTHPAGNKTNLQD